MKLKQEDTERLQKNKDSSVHAAPFTLVMSCIPYLIVVNFSYSVQAVPPS